jgi:hypothetical protein
VESDNGPVESDAERVAFIVLVAPLLRRCERSGDVYGAPVRTSVTFRAVISGPDVEDVVVGVEKIGVREMRRRGRGGVAVTIPRRRKV